MALVLDGTNGVSGVDGTASNPAIEGTDSNTGIFYPAADTVAIGTGGTERLRVDSAGNAGLGATPNAWGASWKSMSFNTVGAVASTTGVTRLYHNAFNNDSNNLYRTTAAASMYSQDGAHQWFIAPSGTAGNAITFTQAMTLDASGKLGIGTASPSGQLSVTFNGSAVQGIVATDTATPAAGNYYLLCGSSGGIQNVVSNEIHLSAVSALAFRTGSGNGTERARITSGGDLLVGKTAANVGVDGCEVGTNYLAVSRPAAVPLIVNRNTDDGTLVSFRQATVEEGTISVSGNTVSYNPFLGSHAGAFADWSRPEVKIGTIFETINELIDYKVVIIEVPEEVPATEETEATTVNVPKRISYNGNGSIGTTATVEYEGQEYTGIIENERGQERDFNKHVKVKINDTPDSKAVYGVFVGWNTDSSNDGGVYNDMLIGAVGNYVIRMAAGQAPEIGDLVKADGAGCAIVQEDDIVRTKTVGKITNTIPQLTYEDGSFLVACVLYCG